MYGILVEDIQNVFEVALSTLVAAWCSFMSRRFWLRIVSPASQQSYFGMTEPKRDISSRGLGTKSPITRTPVGEETTESLGERWVFPGRDGHLTRVSPRPLVATESPLAQSQPIARTDVETKKAEAVCLGFFRYGK
jgi:hypothetical protein